jgi:membrane-bound metal-dependent hydrolase YbcI (DUF457 family)
MPTPIGHALAGLAVVWAAGPSHAVQQPLRRALARPLTLVCIALAVLPDIDLLYPPTHRTATHSVGAIIVVTIIAAGVTGWVTGRINWRIAVVCAAAYASHLVTDWLGADRNYAPYGIQMFWPFDKTWHISGWDVFPQVERRNLLSMATIRTDIAAALWEIVILGSVVLAVWLARTRLPWRNPQSPQRTQKSNTWNSRDTT